MYLGPRQLKDGPPRTQTHKPKSQNEQQRGCSLGARPELKIEHPDERTETGGDGSIAFSYVST